MIEFSPSARSTLGVEWELALVDTDTGDLRQVAPTLLEQVAGPGGSPNPRIHQELLLNTVEIVTGVCHTVPEAVADLQGSIAEVQRVLDPMRVELISAGTHPFAHWGNQKVSDKARYNTLIERTEWWGRQMLIYGVHVHVGVEQRDKVMPLVNALAAFYPHLLALSTSSPFWDGRDTKYASNRALLFQQLPTAGLPLLEIDSWAKLERYVADMMHTGVIDVFGEVRWDIRPAPDLGTIEVRVFDGISNSRELAALVALVHCLVEHLSRLIDQGRPLPSISTWFLTENKWRAARYGTEAIIILNEAGDEELVGEVVRRLVEELAPVAADLGCGRELTWVLEILDGGSSADRQRHVAAAYDQALEPVVAHLIKEFRAGRPLDVD